MNASLCVDASVVVRLLVDTFESERVQGLWEVWQSANRTLVAPTLLYYEVANDLYRYERAGDLEEEVQQTLDAALGLPVRLMGDGALHAKPFSWRAAIGCPPPTTPITSPWRSGAAPSSGPRTANWSGK